MEFNVDSDTLHSVLAALCMVQGCICIGCTTWVLCKYWRDPRWRHIVAVSLSHLILTLLVVQALILRLYELHPIRLPAAIVAFLLTDYGLLKITFKRK